jgi:aspartyl aminopeptidase
MDLVTLMEGWWKDLQVLAEELKCDVTEVADFELSVYDMQPSCVGGMRDEFVFAGRLDNLASSFCALSALLDTCTEPSSLMDESCIRMVALFDIGEVMSLKHLGFFTRYTGM